MTNKQCMEYLGLVYGINTDLNNYSDCAIYLDDRLLKIKDSIEYLRKICNLLDIEIGKTMIQVLIGLELESNPIFIKTFYHLIDRDYKIKTDIFMRRELVNFIKGLAEENYRMTVDALNTAVSSLALTYIEDKLGNYDTNMITLGDINELIGIKKEKIYRINRKLEVFENGKWNELYADIECVHNIESHNRYYNLLNIKGILDINELDILVYSNDNRELRDRNGQIKIYEGSSWDRFRQ